MKPTVAAVSASGLVGFGGQALASGAYYNEPNGPTPLGPAELTFQDENSVRAFNGGVCVNNFLDEKRKQQLGKGVQVNYGEWATLKDTFAYATGRAHGCVAISWIKETGKDGFYKAKVRYEGIFAVGNEALVTYGIFNPEEQPYKVVGKTAYINIKNDRIAGLVRYVDRQHTPIKPNSSSGKEVRWGFSPNVAGNKQCKHSVRCVDEPEKRIEGEEKGTWEENEEGQKKFTDGTKNFGTAFDHIVNNDSHNLTQFKTVVDSRKGIWTRR